MSTKSKRHIHKYHKIQFSFAKVWACALPNCLHYMPQHMEEMVIGKQTFCWGCNDQIILTPINMTDDKPKCVDCKRKEIELLQSLQDRRESATEIDTEDIEQLLKEKGMDN